MSAPDLQRILVVGSSCAGKSTLAAELAAHLRQPCFELDELFWGPDWTPKPDAQFRALVGRAGAGPQWVAAGNYASVRELLWPRVTTIVWLNYSLPTVLWRALRRSLVRGWTGQELWHGNRESLRRNFLSRDSILLWVLRHFHSRRREFEALRAQPPHVRLRWLEFRHPREAQRFLRSLPHSVASQESA